MHSHEHGQVLRKCGVAPRRWGLWSPPVRTVGSFKAPPLGAISTLVREYLLVASGSWASISSGCQPGVRVIPFFAWSVLGSPPFGTVHHCTEQVATDPESPKGGSQQARPLGVPTPRLLGFRRSGVVLAVGPAVERQLGRSLFGMPARGPSRPLCYLIGLWVVALISLVTLVQRGTASDNALD